MKYCLVNPWSRGNHNAPHIGLAYISGVLKHLGHEVVVVDYEQMPFPKGRHLSKSFDVVGFSVKSNTFNEVKLLADALHELRPEVKILFGGPMVTMDKEKILSEMPYGTVSTLYYDEELMVVEGGKEPLGNIGEAKFRLKRLDDLPLPDYSSFDSYDVLKEGFKSGNMIYSLITSRGCTFRCKFCAVPRIGGFTWRQRSVSEIMRELILARTEFGIKHMQMLDDHATANVSRWKEFCNAMINAISDGVLPLDWAWMCPNGIRADVGDDEMFKLMGDSGCYYATLGLEHIKPHLLEKVNKGETFDKVVAGMKLIRPHLKRAQERLGIAWGGVGCFFIMGLPGATVEDDMDCLVWGRQAKVDGLIDLFHCNLYSPYVGTPFWDEVKDFVIAPYTDAVHFGKDLVVTYETPEYPASERLRIMKESGFSW